jgi:hypothetical protein
MGTWNYFHGPSWSHGSWIYNYLCNQCLSPLTLWVRNLFMARCPRYNIMWQSLSVTCDRMMVFFWVLRFPLPIKLSTRYSWNIVESGVKDNKQNKNNHIICHDECWASIIWRGNGYIICYWKGKECSNKFQIGNEYKIFIAMAVNTQ